MKKRFKILMVDDNPTNAQMVKLNLQEEYKIIIAHNGFEAIHLAKSENPDLILLDVMMPEINGFEVCQQLKLDTVLDNVPVIFLTALDTSVGETLGLDVGGIDYLTKPLNFTLLKLRIRNHLDLKAKNDLVVEQRDLLEQQKAELEATLGRIKRLEGLISICMYCKGIRNETNVWERLEEYLSEHTDAQFSHGICPSCQEQKFPQYVKNKTE